MPVTDWLPERPDATREKSFEATPVTGSLNVTDQETEPAAVGDEPVRVIEDTIGAVRSITHVYDVAELVPVFGPLVVTARTWNVCDPLDRPVKLFVDGREVPHVAKAAESSLHSNRDTLWLSV